MEERRALLEKGVRMFSTNTEIYRLYREAVTAD
jgi:hypothetical protein